MCGTKLKTFSVSLVLSFLLLFVPFSFSCYAEVTLTEQEAMEMLNEIQESKKDLTELQTQLNDVKKDYNEQKTSYEKQLDEASRKNEYMKTAVTITGTTSIVLTVIMVVLIML